MPETSTLYARLLAKSLEDRTEYERKFITLHDTLKSAVEDEQDNFAVLLEFKKEINKATRLSELEGKNEAIELTIATIVRNNILAVKIAGELVSLERSIQQLLGKRV